MKRTGRLVVLEDCLESGSVGRELAASLAEAGTAVKALVLRNLKGSFAPQGTVPQLRRALGLDAQAVVETVLAMDDRE